MYRYYVERYFDAQADERAIPVSSADEAGAVCTRLGSAERVALVAHASHRPVLDAVLAVCSDNFQLHKEKEIRSVLGQVWVHR